MQDPRDWYSAHSAQSNRTCRCPLLEEQRTLGPWSSSEMSPGRHHCPNAQRTQKEKRVKHGDPNADQGQHAFLRIHWTDAAPDKSRKVALAGLHHLIEKWDRPLSEARLATGDDDFVQGKYFTATVLSCS